MMNAPTEATPVMEQGAPVEGTVSPVPDAPSQPSASDAGSIRNPIVDPSAFIYRGQRNYGIN